MFGCMCEHTSKFFVSSFRLKYVGADSPLRIFIKFVVKTDMAFHFLTVPRVITATTNSATPRFEAVIVSMTDWHPFLESFRTKTQSDPTFS